MAPQLALQRAVSDMRFIISLMIAIFLMLIISSVLNYVFDVDYFYNPIFFAIFGLGMADFISKKLDSKLED